MNPVLKSKRVNSTNDLKATIFELISKTIWIKIDSHFKIVLGYHTTRKQDLNDYSISS